MRTLQNSQVSLLLLGLIVGAYIMQLWTGHPPYWYGYSPSKHAAFVFLGTVTHASLSHLAVNATYCLLIAYLIEPQLGAARTAGLFTLGLLATATSPLVFSLVNGGQLTSIGTSVCLYVVFGYYLMAAGGVGRPIAEVRGESPALQAGRNVNVQSVVVVGLWVLAVRAVVAGETGPLRGVVYGPNYGHTVAFVFGTVTCWLAECRR